MSTVTATIPAELRELNQWVVWRLDTVDGRPTKVPYNPRTNRKASTTDPATWAPYATCRAALEAGNWSGLGFVFSDEDPYTGIDLDGCLEDGQLTATAEHIVRFLDSYTEVSPSGTGVHIIVRGTPLGDRRRKGRIEMYPDGRFFTMTGETLWNAPATIASRHHELNQLYQHYLADRPQPKPEPTAAPSLTMDDAALIERARRAENGAKFDRLMMGDTSGYDSQSEAEQAFCNLLAFWTDDASQIDRLYRQSGLSRDKWDGRRGESTYGEKTIANALAFVTERYTPPAPKPAAAVDPQPIALEIELLRCEVDQLRAEVRELKADNERLRDERTMMLHAIRNPNLKGEGATGIAVAFEVSSIESRDLDKDGWAAVPLARIAEKAGVSVTTASKHLKRLESYGVIRRRVKRIVSDRVNQETGEVSSGYTSELQIQLVKPARETLRILAEIEPDTSNRWGGKRLVCPKHPDADLIVRRTVECSVCGDVLQETELRRRPEPEPERVNYQDDNSEDDPPYRGKNVVKGDHLDNSEPRFNHPPRVNQQDAHSGYAAAGGAE